MLNVQFVGELLVKKGWSVRKLALRSGLSPATISRIMTGKRRAGMKSANAIRRAFPDVPVNSFFNIKE